MRRKATILGSTLIVLLLSVSVWGQVEYELYIVKPFRPGGLSEAYVQDINNEGIAVGTATDETYHGFFWTEDSDKIDTGVGTIDGINNHGSAVGNASYWIDPETVFQIPAPDDFYHTVHAFDISDSDIVVGEAVHRYHSNWSEQIPIVWDAQHGTRSLMALGVPGGFAANAVNDSGQIAGVTSVGRSLSDAKAFYFDLESRELIHLGTFMQENVGSSIAQDINADGVIAGAATYPGIKGKKHAFRWTKEDGLEDLGVLGVYRSGHLTLEYSHGNGINDSGVVVGRSTVSDAHSQWDSAHAFIWDEKHGMRDLNKLVDLPPDYYLIDAKAISDTGWIVGTSFGSAGEVFYSGFVLKPIGVGEACGDKARLKSKCKGGGSKVTAVLKKADHNVDVTFQVNGAKDKIKTTNDKGKAKASWKKLERGSHRVTVCDLDHSC